MPRTPAVPAIVFHVPVNEPAASFPHMRTLVPSPTNTNPGSSGDVVMAPVVLNVTFPCPSSPPDTPAPATPYQGAANSWTTSSTP